MVGLTPGFAAQIQSNAASVAQGVKRISDWLQKYPLASYQIIKDITATSTGTVVRHSLKRVPNGYLVIRKNAGNAIYDSGFTKETITLRAASNTICTILIF